MWATTTGTTTPPSPSLCEPVSQNPATSPSIDAKKDQDVMQVLIKHLTHLLEQTAYFDALAERALSALRELEAACSFGLPTSTSEAASTETNGASSGPAQPIRAALHASFLLLLAANAHIVEHGKQDWGEELQGIDRDELKLLLEMYAAPSGPLSTSMPSSASTQDGDVLAVQKKSPDGTQMTHEQEEQWSAELDAKNRRQSWAAPYSPPLPTHAEDPERHRTPVRSSRMSHVSSSSPSAATGQSGGGLTNIRRKNSRRRQSEQLDLSHSTPPPLHHSQAHLERSHSDSPRAGLAVSAGLRLSLSTPSHSLPSRSHMQAFSSPVLPGAASPDAGHLPRSPLAESIPLSSEAMRRVQSDHATTSFALQGVTNNNRAPRRPLSLPPGVWGERDNAKQETAQRKERRHSSYYKQFYPTLAHARSQSPAYPRLANSHLHPSPHIFPTGFFSDPEVYPSAVKQTPPNRYTLEGLQAAHDRVQRARKEFLCYLLALKSPSTIEPAALARTAAALAKWVQDMASSLSTATADLSRACDEELGPTSQVFMFCPDDDEMGPSTLAKKALGTPSIGGEAFSFPGQYPSRPLIEIDPATPPQKTHGRSSSTSRRQGQREQIEQRNYAPRDPRTLGERAGHAAFVDSSVRINAALRRIAATIRVNRRDVDLVMASSSSEADASGQDDLDRIASAHNGMRHDLDSLLREWEAGRVALRQMAEGRRQQPSSRRRHHHRGTEEEHPSFRHSTSPSLAGTPPDLASLVRRTNSNSKRGSVSSVLSSDLETPPMQSLSPPPNLYPLHTAEPLLRSGGDHDVSQLLLDQTSPKHLPPPGMQELLFETVVASDKDEEDAGVKVRKVSRDERIRLAKLKRGKSELVVRERGEQPLAKMELVTELKDVMALLRYVDPAAPLWTCGLGRG